ncbi:MAG: diguanylate cyclase domain-containing protein [Pseudomonadales bacterium]
MWPIRAIPEQFSRCLDWFIPLPLRAADQPIVGIRALVAMLLASLFNLLAIGPIVATSYPFTSTGLKITVLAWAVSLLMSLSSLWCIRVAQRATLATHLFLLSIYLPIMLIASFSGGASSPVANLLLALPIISGFLFAWQFGFCWLLIACCSALFFAQASAWGLQLPQVVPQVSTDRLAMLSLGVNLAGVGVVLAVYTIVHAQVIAELHSQRAKFERLAHQDQLTTLPNRLSFMHTLELALVEAGHLKQKVGLLVIDLDGFKAVNDTYGHATGDSLLNTIGQRLENNIRGVDFAARLGGDEFVVVFNDVKSRRILASKAAQLMCRLQEPIFIIGIGEIKVGVSIGAAIYPDSARIQADLFARADEQMFRAKRAGMGFKLAGNALDSIA